MSGKAVPSRGTSGDPADKQCVPAALGGFSLRPLLCPHGRGRAQGRLSKVSLQLACFLTSCIAPGSYQLLLPSRQNYTVEVN